MWEVENLHEKLNNLPEPTRSFATSLKAAEINTEIFNVSNVEAEKQSDLTLLIAGIIVKEIKLDGLEDKIAEFLDWDEEKALNLATEIVGSRLLILDDWLDGAPENYLSKHSVDPSRFAPIIAEHQLAVSKEADYFKEQLKEEEPYVFEENSDSFDDVLDKDDEEVFSEEEGEENQESEKVDFMQDVDIQEEKKSLLQTLKKGLLAVLEAQDKDILDRYNYLFVLVWLNDEDFKEKAPQALMTNSEKISNNNLNIEGEEKKATISELIKGFVKINGLEANDLHIAEFLSSKAVQNLSDKEKVLVLRILKFYNNINNLDSYLSEDFENVPGGFEVLPPPAPPVKKKKEQITEAKKTLQPKKEARKEESGKKPETSKKEEIAVDEEKQEEKSVADELNPKTSNLANELQVMLQDYPKDSLEYKTIYQELKRLQDNS